MQCGHCALGFTCISMEFKASGTKNWRIKDTVTPQTAQLK